MVRIFIAGFCLLLISSVQAYQECDNIALDHRFDEHRLRIDLLNRVPVKYLQEGIKIKLHVSSTTDLLFPHAYPTKNQIVVPKDFLSMACKIVLTEYLYVSGIHLSVINQSAQIAASCFEQQANPINCLENFASNRARVYTSYFDKLPERNKQTALGIYYACINQILIHEYAHIFLDHYARINKGKLKQIDAEFEADYFAIMNGIQEAEAPSAMYYFFHSIANIQKYTKKLDTVKYESGSCRTQNVENITSVVGLDPILIVEASYPGAYSQSTIVNPQQFIKARPKHSFKITITKECGRLSATVLRDSYDELKRVYARVNNDLEYLFAKNQEQDIVKAKNYISDLSNMSLQLRYMNGIAAKAVASFLRGWTLKGNKLSPIVDKVDVIVNIKDEDNNFLTGDFGRILLTRGLAVLQEQTYIERNKRLTMATNLLNASVYYNPLLAEAWDNLAFISLERADCQKAEQYANRGVATSTDDNQRKSIQYFANAMHNLANDQAGCSRMATKFKPYPGL